MKLGIVGATGLVGQAFLRHLRSFFGRELSELRLFSRSGAECLFEGKSHKTSPLRKGCFKGLDICFFSAGASVSCEWAPRAACDGAMVIDNSSAFRRDPDAPLIVPEINGHLLPPLSPLPARGRRIISNPNCSTIQLAMALYPLHKTFGLNEVRVVSLQSASGAGRQALDRLRSGSMDILTGKKPYEMEALETAFNCVPYIGEIGPNGFCGEEEKIIHESRKIMGAPGLKISAFTVRVPCLNSHGEAVWLSLKKPASQGQINKALEPFVRLQKAGEGPPHGRQASGKREVFAGRIHKDGISENSLVMWLAADNLLKGASINGLQIAEALWKRRSGRPEPGGAAKKGGRSPQLSPL